MKNKFELLMSVQWYFEIKNLSLENILEIKIPLSIEKQKEMRIYYSQYFTSLVSAIEILLDKNENKKHKEFYNKLKSEFVFDNFLDGSYNYEYIKNLRNSIIHRGMDITLSAHIKDSFPLVIAQPVIDKYKKNTYQPFEFYLIGIIQKCELYFPDIILNYFQEFNFFNIEEMEDELRLKATEYMKNISNEIVPQLVKDSAGEYMSNIDFISIQKNLIDNCIKIIKTDLLGVKDCV